MAGPLSSSAARRGKVGGARVVLAGLPSGVASPSRIRVRGTVARLDAEAFAFPPDGLLWRVCRERCNLLDGAAAAILQVAHPKIAAGVRDHSDFRRGPLARLQRTLDGVNTIAFGTRAQADAMSARIAARHAAVRGEVADDGGGCYSADDPELLMW